MHLINRIESRNYKINKVSLSCFYAKIYPLSNGYDGLALGC